VHTEDHPLSYIDFDGEIPKGEYGGGEVHLWDQGTYDVKKWTDREVMVELHGNRVNGTYVLFQTGGRNWMIHRMDPPDDPTRELVPKDARPVEPSVVSELPVGEEWRYLIAWKGERVALAVDGGRCVARNESGKDVTKSWPVLGPFGRAVGALPVVFVAQLASGTVFLDDVQWLDGHPTTPLPFDKRRELLEQLDLNGDAWKTSPVYDDGPAVLEAARAQGQRGVFAIRGDSLGDEPPLLVS
jgi:bifunctional non-homologous end joining protein LigD